MDELLARTAELEMPALGMTDVNNLCGALEFARAATALGIQPISGADLLLAEGGASAPVSLLAESGAGYANLSRLLSLAHRSGGRRTPMAEATLAPEHTVGLILLAGAPGSRLARLVDRREWAESEATLRRYRDWFSGGSVYLELNSTWCGATPRASGASASWRSVAEWRRWPPTRHGITGGGEPGCTTRSPPSGTISRYPKCSAGSKPTTSTG